MIFYDYRKIDDIFKRYINEPIALQLIIGCLFDLFFNDIFKFAKPTRLKFCKIKSLLTVGGATKF